MLTVVKEGRLRWFSHIKGLGGEGLLGEVMKLEVLEWDPVYAQGSSRRTMFI